jgi:hypothetical protein
MKFNFQDVKKKSGLLAVLLTISVEHGVLSVHLTGPSLTRLPIQATPCHSNASVLFNALETPEDDIYDITAGFSDLINAFTLLRLLSTGVKIT